MTRVRIEHHPEGGGICLVCEHDLEVRKDGLVYCTNPGCDRHKTPHATGKQINCPDRFLPRKKS